LASSAIATASACNALVALPEPGGGAGGAGAVGGRGGDAGSGGDASCERGQKSCDGTCVAVADPLYGCGEATCAACANSADPCVGTACAPCPLGTDDCDQSGSCDTELDDDPAHCGRCGHDCLGGDCVDGACQPVSLATGQATLWAITQDASHVYFSAATNAGEWSFYRVAKAGGAPELVAALGDTHLPRDIAVDDAELFWADWDMASVFKVGKTGGGAVEQVTPFTAVFMRTLSLCGPSDTSVYFGSVFNDGLHSAPKAGGAASPVATAFWPFGLTCDDTHLYWIDNDTAMGPMVGRIRRAPKIDGSQAVDIAAAAVFNTDTAISNIGGDIHLEGNHVYWLNANGEIARVVKDGSMPAEIFLDDEVGAAGLTVDSQHLYWLNHDEGRVKRLALADPRSVEVLAEGEAGPVAIVGDASAIFWTNAESGVLRKLAK
jgi:hypothetical protein